MVGLPPTRPWPLPSTSFPIQ